MKAILIDDEEHARNLLALFLHKIGGVTIVGQAGNARDALACMREQQPDVVFLDIEMPEVNGLELAETINGEFADVHLVFVTAYDRYAIAAFEQEALDYILKPLEMKRLERTVARVRKELEKDAPKTAPASAASDCDAAPKLHIRLFGGFEATDGSGRRFKMRTSKEKELLAYLAAHADSRPHRDVILEQLWPGEHHQKAKVYLHTCVSYLRKNLKALGTGPIVLFEDQRYFLDVERVAIDWLLFRRKMEALRRQKTPVPDEIEDVLALCGGPLFGDSDYMWAEGIAEACDQETAILRLSLAKAYWDRGEAEQAAQTAERLCSQDPYNEEAHRCWIASLQKLGRHQEAVRVYRKLEQTLRQELQLEPSGITKRLLQGNSRTP
ncbi:MAG: response regulator [Paenibacillaceae bacterium]|nr:response regulator [Paenibacillaceae bacterium]